VSEFCRTEDELIALAQQAVRKLLGAQVETPSLSTNPSESSGFPSTGSSAPSGILEIRAKVQGAQVYVDGLDMGEVPARVSNLSPGTHELRVAKRGYEDWKQAVQLRPNEKKIVDVVLKVSVLGEDYLLDRIFYFEDCFFARDKFEYWVKFRKGGVLEGAPRRGRNYVTPPKEGTDFNTLPGRWSIEKNQVIIDFDMLRGIQQRKILKVKVDLSSSGEDYYHTIFESSRVLQGDTTGFQYFAAGSTEEHSCRMREFFRP